MILKIDRKNDFLIVKAHLHKLGFKFDSIDGYKNCQYAFINPLVHKRCGLWLDFENKIYDIGTYTIEDAKTVADFNYYKEKFMGIKRGVIKINPYTNEELDYYDSPAQAERANKIYGSQIITACNYRNKNGKRKTCKGFYWKYKD